MLFCRLLIFSKSIFSKNSFWNIIRVSNSLDPDQALHFVGPDLGPNCLQSISADNTSRQDLRKSNYCDQTDKGNVYAKINASCA